MKMMNKKIKKKKLTFYFNYLFKILKRINK